MKRLPDAEFEIMKIVWINQPPISSNTIMDQLGKEKGWKAPTILTLMNRLVERNFLRTEKNGKERTYFPLVSKEDYLTFETENFMMQYHEGSFINLVSSLYDGKKLNADDIEELLAWTEKRRD